MCNISELYLKRGEERAKIEIMVRMFEHDIPIDIIAAAVEMSVEETQKLIDENKSSFSTNPPNL